MSATSASLKTAPAVSGPVSPLHPQDWLTSPWYQYMHSYLLPGRSCSIAHASLTPVTAAEAAFDHACLSHRVPSDDLERCTVLPLLSNRCCNGVAQCASAGQPAQSRPAEFAAGPGSQHHHCHWLRLRQRNDLSLLFWVCCRSTSCFSQLLL